MTPTSVAAAKDCRHVKPSSIRSTPTFFRAVLSALRQALFGLAASSALINILALTGSMFMLQVYDRVIPSHSLPTLVGLAVIAATLYGFQGVLDLLRSMVMARIGMSIEEGVNRKLFSALLGPSNSPQSLQSIRDMDQVKSFLSGPGPTALFDLPWIPLYLAICFAFHPWIGATALASAVILCLLAVFAETLSQAPSQAASGLSAERFAFAEGARANWEAITAMGYGGQMADRFEAISRTRVKAQLKANDIIAALTIASKILRMMMQSSVLAVGAILVIRQEATGGIMIASSILLSRALAPVEIAISQWRAFVQARQSWSRVQANLKSLPEEQERTSLPAPAVELRVEGLSIAPPGSFRPTVRNVAFTITAGTVLGIIGPSASGKSTLARAIVGLWTPLTGSIRLDRAALTQWRREELGHHIGYLPQDVGLFSGTVAENIARFDPDRSADAVISAAKAAGVYDMIVRMENGFETEVGEGGHSLSAGQRQRLALARALYRDPFLVVLDEPNSNLDADGEAALTDALLAIKARRGIVIVVAHRPSAITAADQLLVLTEGAVQALGRKEDVLRSTTRMRLIETTGRQPGYKWGEAT
jgi:PrtD family type I secretion system ABC transporter